MVILGNPQRPKTFINYYVPSLVTRSKQGTTMNHHYPLRGINTHELVSSNLGYCQTLATISQREQSFKAQAASLSKHHLHDATLFIINHYSPSEAILEQQIRLPQPS